MKNQTHSPLPWGVRQTGPVMAGYTQPLAIVQDGEPNIIAGIFGDVAGGLPVAQANAHLITIAANNHEALRRVLQGLDDCGLLDLKTSELTGIANTHRLAARALLVKIKEEERE